MSESTGSRLDILEDIRRSFGRETIMQTAARLGIGRSLVWQTRLKLGLQTKWKRHAGKGGAT